MRCLLLLIALLGATHAGPFFKLRFGPEHRTVDEDEGPELPLDEDPFPERVPDESAAVFALQLPKLDLSALFKPLRVFAGVNVNGLASREQEPNCDVGKFDLSDEDFDLVMDCEKSSEGDEIQLKECILVKLPKTNVELRAFLDREEYGVAGLSSSFHLSLLNGEFTQKRSVQFRVCPRDEVNSIDGEIVPVVQEIVPVVEEVVPMVEQMVPIETLTPDRIDGPVMVEETPSGPVAVRPQRPLFQFPELKFPDLGQIFSEAFAPVFGPRPGDEGDASLGLFGSHLNPFAVRHPPAVSGPQQGFFASLFPALAATPPPEGPPDDDISAGIDMSNCVSKKFEVSRFVFNVANRCQYANDYRKCLRMDLGHDASAKEFMEFASDPEFSVVASSFSSFQTTFDLESLQSGHGLGLTRKNQIDLRRCANIKKEVVTEEAPAAEEIPADEKVEGAEVFAEGAEEGSGFPESEITEEVVPEEVMEIVPEFAEVVPEVTEEVLPEVAADAVPEEVPVVVEEYPADSAPGAEVTPEVAPEDPKVITEVFEVVPEAPVEPAVDAEQAVVEAKEVVAEAEAPVAEAEAPVVEAEVTVPVVEVEAPVVEAEVSAQAEEPKEVEKEVAEAEKAAAEIEKAVSEVEQPAEVAQKVESDIAYVAEP